MQYRGAAPIWMPQANFISGAALLGRAWTRVFRCVCVPSSQLVGRGCVACGNVFEALRCSCFLFVYFAGHVFGPVTVAY